MRKSIVFSLILILLACNQPAPKGNHSEAAEIASAPDQDGEPTVQAQQHHSFKILEKPTYDLAKLDHEGTIAKKRFWMDANGENIALFTLKEEELFVYHYAIRYDTVSELRKVYDFEKACEFDLFLDFIDKSITVTDLDQNHIGELTFAYKKACISDVSPLGLKLLILENGNKYIIRGTTTIEESGFALEGSKTVDASFNDAPASFLSHANEVWDKVKVQAW